MKRCFLVPGWRESKTRMCLEGRVDRSFVRSFSSSNVQKTDRHVQRAAAVIIVALILFSSLLFSCRRRQCGLAVVNVLLSFDSRLAFASSSFFSTTSVSLDQCPRNTANEHKRASGREKQKWAMSLFSLLSERTTRTKEMSGWTCNPFLLSCSIWRSVQTHCRLLLNRKKTPLTTPPIVSNDQRHSIKYVQEKNPISSSPSDTWHYSRLHGIFHSDCWFLQFSHADEKEMFIFAVEFAVVDLHQLDAQQTAVDYGQ